jgi:hypothetical protein
MAKTKDVEKQADIEVEPTDEEEVEPVEPTPEEAEEQAAQADEPEPEEETPEVVRRAELAVREAGDRATVSPATMPTPNEWEAMRAMAATIAATEFVPSSFRNRPEPVLAAILTGRELGLGPMNALKDISIIDGRPALSANLMLSLMRRGGIQIVESESTSERATIRARRPDTGEEMTVEWTMEEAKKIKRKGKALTDGDNWKNYPADMLWARAVGRLGRRLGGDLLAGFPYTAEEVADFKDEEPIDDYASGPITNRVEGPVQKVPESWQELIARLEAVVTGREEPGEDGPVDAIEWLREATEVHFGKPRAELDESQQKELRIKSIAVLLGLEDAHGGKFPPPARTEIAKAFAAKFVGGAALEGPPWRTAPTEDDRPTYAQWKESQPDAPEQGEAAVDPEAEAIPFGDADEGDK